MTEFRLKDVTSLDLAVGAKQEAEVEGLDGAKVLLVNVGGTVQALGPKCTHYGAPLVKGVLTADGRLTCPWHGACFHATTGDVEDAPALDALPTFRVEARDGGVYVAGDAATIRAGRRGPKKGTVTRKTAAGTADTTEHVVVVGGGAGAVGAVEELHAAGFGGRVTMVSNEGYLPVDRPKLSKALVADARAVQLRDQAWFDAAGIAVVADEVTAVDPARQSVSTRGGTTLTYTKLILATGSTARTLPRDDGFGLRNITTMRNVHDVKTVVDALAGGRKKVVVIGSSFIGLEAANATVANHDVCVVGTSAVPLEHVLGHDVGAAAQKALEARGVTFYLSASVDRAEPSTRDPDAVGAVVLKDGTRLDADVVVLGIGVTPATAFLRGNDAFVLEADGSLATDASFAVRGVPGVYAVGDIATFPYHGPGASADGTPVRIEHWNVAQNAGRRAAQHIVSPTTASAAPQFVPVFWSALAAQLRYCGSTAVAGFDDVVIQGSLADGAWAAFYGKGGVVVAVATMGKDPVMVQSAELMRAGTMPSLGEIKSGLDVLTLKL